LEAGSLPELSPLAPSWLLAARLVLARLELPAPVLAVLVWGAVALVIAVLAGLLPVLPLALTVLPLLATAPPPLSCIPPASLTLLDTPPASVPPFPVQSGSGSVPPALSRPKNARMSLSSYGIECVPPGDDQASKTL